MNTQTKEPIKAVVTWCAEDIQTIKPDWSLEQCQEFLESNVRNIQDRLIEVGWEVLDALVSWE
jgi:hypothetical protein